jgi:hypothetical protein
MEMAVIQAIEKFYSKRKRNPGTVFDQPFVKENTIDMKN